MKITHKRNDGTFVGEKNGMPFHYTKDDPEFEKAKKAGKNAPPEPAFVEPAKSAEMIQRLKREAYANQSDPLFFEWQAGERTKKDWLDARKAVRDSF